MAPTGDVLFFTFIILGLLITLAGFQLLVTALLPRVVSRSRETMTRRPIVSGVFGLVSFLITVGLVQGLTGLGGPGVVVGMILLVTMVTLGVGGLAALSRLVGERMPSAIDETSPWRPTLRGAITTELAFAAPVAGWILFGVAVAVAGGAGVLGGTGLHRMLSSLRKREPKQATLYPSPPAAPTPDPASPPELDLEPEPEAVA